MLERGTADDVAPFIDLLEDAAADLAARDIDQWQPGSFVRARDVIALAQETGALLVLRERGRIVAGVVLTGEPDPIWADVPDAAAAYLHRLVVARSHAGSGLGARVLDAAERAAHEAGYIHVRLDCVAGNTALARWYQARGYFPRGVVQTRHGALLRHDKRVAPLVDDVTFAALDEVDFEHWRVDDVATLCFVVDGPEVLLIRKKRGHGAGKVNGPGGKAEPGESPLACAIRETREEVGIDPTGLDCRAELRFQESTGYAMRGFAFVATGFSGAPVETAEAAPFWCRSDALPLDAMWEDDRIWLPRVLEGEHVVAEFLFHRDHLVAHRLETVPAQRLASCAEGALR